MNTDVLFSSASGEWETPQAFFDGVNNACHFNLDVCATVQNTKCEKFFTIEDDALQQIWSGMCWQNPPYGRGIVKWMCKAYEESLKPGTCVVCLVPARTDTAWWHKYAVKGHRLYIKGRLKFGGQENSAPFPSALVIFGGSMPLVMEIQKSLADAGYGSST